MGAPGNNTEFGESVGLDVDHYPCQDPRLGPSMCEIIRFFLDHGFDVCSWFLHILLLREAKQRIVLLGIGSPQTLRHRRLTAGQLVLEIPEVVSVREGVIGGSPLKAVGDW